MKGRKLIGCAAIFIMFFSFWCGLAVTPAHAALQITQGQQLTSNASDQENPAIYEYGLNSYAVVWQDNRNGNWDIHMYYQQSLGNGTYPTLWDTPITANSGNNINPKIYNDTIVYQSDRNGNWDIYMYNITSKVETQITNNTADQEFPAIYGNIIVWQDYRDASWNTLWDTVNGIQIYMYNLTSHTEERLPLQAQNVFSPTISGDNVVYIEETYQPWGSETLVSPYVCSYNLLTGVKTTLAAGKTDYTSAPGIFLDDFPQTNSPAIAGNLVAWTDNRFGNVVVKDMSRNSTWLSGNGYYKNPDVGGSYVVFQTYYYGYWHIDVYDSSDGLLSQATNATGNQENPALSSKWASYLVYQDNRSGNWHIYLTAFWSGGGSTGVLTAPNPFATSSTPPANATNSGNQDLTIMAIVAVVAVVAIGAAVFAVTRRRKPKKQELLHAPQSP